MATSKNQSALIEFVRSLPVGPAYAPIYAKGVVFGKSASRSTGKAPHEASHHRKFSPNDVALLLEQQPDLFQAVGLFTGIRSDGIVILDVDANLSTLLTKWGASVEQAPRIHSTKPNAAKFVFRVPTDQRSQVRGFTLSQSQMGYEVLWGMQGVIAGAYPGSSDGKAQAGEYTLLNGSFDSIPDAPEWLLAEMRARAQQGSPVQGIVKNRKGLDFSGRTNDEVAEIIHDCLHVLPHLGRGSEDQWWQIGAMVAEALPNDLGLALWSAWSAQDPAFEDDWTKGNPCEEKWERLVSRAGHVNNLGLGSLVKLADEYDPQRERFQESSRRTLEEVEKSQVQIIRQVAIGFEEMISRARELMELDNPAEMNYRLHALAVEAGYRDKEHIDKLLVDQMQYELGTDLMEVGDLLDRDFHQDYIIPDVLPTPSVVLIYGAGGDGKSMSAWTLAKHVALGIPFVVRGKHVPVTQGPVLVLNGDQPLGQIKEQLEEVEIPKTAPMFIRTDWSIYRYAQFVKLLEDLKPKLVIIDSLIGCSGGKAFDENKSDFATPLYWLTRNNGVLFPPTTILVVHHANKQGGFRGTTAIRDAVDEVWALKRPSERQQEVLGANARLVGIEKSRSGRGGSSLLMRLEDDLTFSLSDYVPEIDPTETGPMGITDRVLARLRVVYPEGRTRAEMNADPIVGGRVTAIKKALQRLEKRKLIAATDLPTPSGHRGSPLKLYKAILSEPRVVVGTVCPTKEKPSQDNDFKGGHPYENEGVCPTLEGHAEVCPGTSDQESRTGGHPCDDQEACPPLDPLQEKGSASRETETATIHAREFQDRSDDELLQMLESSFKEWD